MSSLLPGPRIKQPIQLIKAENVRSRLVPGFARRLLPVISRYEGTEIRDRSDDVHQLWSGFVEAREWPDGSCETQLPGIRSSR